MGACRLMRVILAVILALYATPMMANCLQPRSHDPEVYCRDRLSHKPDMRYATEEARQYALDNCIRQKKIRDKENSLD